MQYHKTEYCLLFTKVPGFDQYSKNIGQIWVLAKEYFLVPDIISNHYKIVFSVVSRPVRLILHQIM